jgi:hypothetical protein
MHCCLCSDTPKVDCIILKKKKCSVACLTNRQQLLYLAHDLGVLLLCSVDLVGELAVLERGVLEGCIDEKGRGRSQRLAYV